MAMSAAVQRVVAVYEAKQAEVLREAAGLRAALDHLQKEHRALINQQVTTFSHATSHTQKANQLLLKEP